ncbi:glucuronate isomerase [Escherichia coli]
MTPFMTEDFLLDTEFARRLYHDYAKDQPIFDYHCHLPPQQIAENYRFKNLYDILAERRSLQMARYAYQRCGRASVYR